MIDVDTRLRVARGLAKTETQASVEVFETLKARGHPERPPATLSDGWGGIGEAMVEVYGQVPPYKGLGRRPTKKRAGPDWQYAQMVKQRTAQGRVIGTEFKVIYGDPDEVLSVLGSSTAYVERTHLTMRHMNRRLVRRGLCFSKELRLHRAAAVWEDVVYNLVRPLKSLREELNAEAARFERRWRHRSPAMAAGLTDELWTIEQILRTVPLPAINNT